MTGQLVFTWKYSCFLTREESRDPLVASLACDEVRRAMGIAVGEFMVMNMETIGFLMTFRTDISSNMSNPGSRHCEYWGIVEIRRADAMLGRDITEIMMGREAEAVLMRAAGHSVTPVVSIPTRGQYNPRTKKIESLDPGRDRR